VWDAKVTTLLTVVRTGGGELRHMQMVEEALWTSSASGEIAVWRLA
jgi:hypothetical protein